jgi:hypothetical protein
MRETFCENATAKHTASQADDFRLSHNVADEAMKLTNHSAVPVYTISGSSTARPLPEWLARKRKRSLKNDPEYASRIELLQDFEFEEASQCIRVSDDGDWVMSTGKIHDLKCLVVLRVLDCGVSFPR